MLLETGAGPAENHGPAGLAERISRGERAAEDEFVRNFGPGVRVLVRRHSGAGRAQVEDLAQEVLSQLLVQLRANALDEPEALPAYVRQAVVFAVAADRRKQARRREDDSVDTELLSARDNPETELRREQLRAAVQRLLSELPVVRDREVLRRFYLEEHDRSEICSALGIDDSHFHRVIHRARRRFADILSEAGLADG
jgi:RNA polymerase sigma-70 factor (ECF subfamily)